MEKLMVPTCRPDPVYRPPEIPLEPMEFLARSWSVSALEVSKALTPLNPQNLLSKTEEEEEPISGETEETGLVSGKPFSFTSSETSQMVIDRILSHSVHGRGSENEKPGKSFSVSLCRGFSPPDASEWSPAGNSIDIAFPSAGPESFPQVIQSTICTPSFESMFPSAKSPRAPR